ncbi:MAG: MFS transporter [Patescibacteria group bacterium]|nr:MFS transporter [Patescibacteria group bacterium]
MQIKININLSSYNINRIIKFFVISDLMFLGGWGLIVPLFSVFLLQDVPNTTLFSVGVIIASYWIVRSVVQMPVAIYLDKREGEKDDFYTLILALMLAGLTAMLYLLVKSVSGALIVAVLQGIAFGLYVPSWSAIFSRHLDKNHYAFDWSLDNTTIGLASGVSAFIGGGMAKFLGFEAVFILVSILSFLSAFMLLMVPNLILPKPTLKVPFIKDHTPATIEE